MRHEQWYAVRCCCVPKKVFGFIQGETTAGRIEVTLKTGTKKSFAIRPISAMDTTCFDFTKAMEVAPVAIPTMERAIYSEDHPIEFWRMVIGFVEAKDEVDAR